MCWLAKKERDSDVDWQHHDIYINPSPPSRIRIRFFCAISPVSKSTTKNLNMLIHNLQHAANVALNQLTMMELIAS